MSDLYQQELDRVTKAVEGSTNNGREEIALLAPKGCMGVELGVDTGQFSKRILDLDHLGILHSVDKWDDHGHSRFQYLAVSKLLLKYEKSKLWHMTAQEFSTLLPDASLGFIYIDCYAHTGQDDGAVLDCLWPKLKDGGIFSGDDYDEAIWPKTFAAVNRFADKHSFILHIRSDFIGKSVTRQDQHPTWWIRK